MLIIPQVVDPKDRKGWTLQPCTVTLHVGGRQPSAPLPDNNPEDKLQTGTIELSGAATPLASCPNAADANFVQ